MSKELEQYNHDKLFDELSALIEQGKQKIAFAANSTLTLLFWHLGNRINEEVLHNERAEYGKRIVEIIMNPCAYTPLPSSKKSLINTFFMLQSWTTCCPHYYR
jgi:hypothetical protein